MERAFELFSKASASPSLPIDGSDRSRVWLDGSTSLIEERSETLSMTWRQSRDDGPTVGWPVRQRRELGLATVVSEPCGGQMTPVLEL